MKQMKLVRGVTIEPVEKRPRMYGGGIKILRGKRQLYDCKVLILR